MPFNDANVVVDRPQVECLDGVGVVGGDERLGDGTRLDEVDRFQLWPHRDGTDATLGRPAMEGTRLTAVASSATPSRRGSCGR